MSTNSIIKEEILKRILLVNPPITHQKLSGVPLVPPLGLAYIAAVLEQNNYEVKILDSLALGINTIETSGDLVRVGLSDRDTKRYIEEFEPDVVGIGAMYTTYVSDAHTVARLVKEACPDTPVVFGGAHTSIVPEDVLKDNNVDIAVIGEGELTFLELVKNLTENGVYFDLAGTVIKKDNRIISNHRRPLIQDVNSLPLPARHLLPMGVYLRKSPRYAIRPPIGHMITSRGCPRSCVFCTNHIVWGRQWRSRSPQSTADEIEHLTSVYGVREIHFIDDNMSLNKKRMTQICHEIIRRGIDIKWTTPNGIAVWTLDKSLLQLMKESGCYRLTFGIESGNIETKIFIGKTFKLDEVKELIKYANRIGLWTVSTYIIGFPYETLDSIEDTIRYAIDSDTDYAIFYLLMAYLGSDVRRFFEKENLLQDDFIESGFYSSMYDTKFFTKQELKQLQKSAYSRFRVRAFRNFLNPIRLLRKINSLEDIVYIFRLGWVFLRMFFYQKTTFGKISYSKLYYR